MSDPRREASQKSQPPRATHTIRFSDSEWRTVLDLADAAGLKPTVLVRRSALGQRLRRRPAASHQALAGALADRDRQLARIGNNLNQLTRLAHVGRVRASDHFREVLGRTIGELKASRAEIHAALDAVADPLDDPHADPHADPLGDPVADPLDAAPVGDPLDADALGDPHADPLGDAHADPVADPLGDPLGGPLDDPHADPLADPSHEGER